MCEYPQHDREISQIFSSAPPTSIHQSQGAHFWTQIDQTQEKLNKNQKKHEKMVNSERF